VVASLKSIAIQEELKKYRGLAISCMNLAMIYQQLKLPEKQKEYADKGLENARKSNEDEILMLAYLQQTHYYTEINDFLKAKIYIDSASVYYNDNFEFTRKQGYFLHKANTFQNLNQHDSAVFYYQKCHDLAKSINSRWNMTEPLMQIGYIYLQQKNYSEAENYLKMGLEIAEKDSILTFMKEGYGTLSDVHAATGNYKEAFEYLQKNIAIKDSIQSEDRKKFTLELEKKYETEKKETQVRLQELEITKRKSITHGLLVITSAIIVILILVFLNFKNKNRLQTEKITKLETEKQLLATEAVLKGEEQERTRLAKDLHDGLGGLLSGIKYSFQNMKDNLILTPENAQVFERSLDMLDSSIHEMRRVAHNLMPETLFKFGLDMALNDFCTAINNSGVLQLKYQSFGLENTKLNHSVSVSVYRIVQELVNNIVKHAEAKLALVQLTVSENLLLIDVEDNGKGFDTDKLKDQKGIGWNNVSSRIDYLDGKLELNSQPGKGTIVHIEIKMS
jgi:signal transduction histidine kinase